jgi:PAP2 superfamily
MGRILLTVLLVTSISLFSNTTAVTAAPNKPPADQYSSEVASTWFELLYDVVKAERTTPPPAARIYGIAAVALYESIVNGTEANRSLVGQLNGLVALPEPHKKNLHWPTVANAALADTIRGLFGSSLSAGSLNNINLLEERFADSFEETVQKQEFERSVSHGQLIASGILSWASGDGFSINNNCPYVPVSVPGAWQPTPPALNPNPLQPCWGFLRPMVLTSGAECPPVPHPAFSTSSQSDFYAAALQVYNVRLNLTDLQKTIADYWSDGPAATGTPSGHWIAIVSQIARNDDLSLAEAAEAYARVGIAVHDAFIACWNAKYAFNLQRPVTYINNNIDSNWRPYIVTPNFPTYTSGHSSQSAAAASVLTDMFGLKQFVDTTHTDHGLVPAQQPRTFNSFADAAAEAAISRLYGGIHFAFDNNNGMVCGECIGQKIHDRVMFRAE